MSIKQQDANGCCQQYQVICSSKEFSKLNYI